MDTGFGHGIRLVRQNGKFNAFFLQSIQQIGYAEIEFRLYVKVATIIFNIFFQAGIDVLIIAMFFGQGPFYKSSRAIFHKLPVSWNGMSWKIFFGQNPVDRITDILQGVDQRSVKIEKYGFKYNFFCYFNLF